SLPHPIRVQEILLWLIPLGVVVLDQASKVLVEESFLPDGAPVTLISGQLFLTQVRNSGLASGAWPGAGPLAVLAAALTATYVTARLASLLRQGEDLPLLLVAGLGTVLGGTLGNTLDRLRLGAVVDFLNLGGWLVFNLADAAITLGILALLWFV